MSEMKLKVMKTIFNLSDEWEYNIYESDDIAEYAQMDKTEVKNIMSELYDEGYLGECMSAGDDGY
jgi:transcription initiation factor IIE alpha subunit